MRRWRDSDPNANSNGNGYSYCDSHRHSHSDSNCDGNCHSDRNSHSHADSVTNTDAVRRKMYSDAAASPDTSASPVGRVTASLGERKLGTIVSAVDASHRDAATAASVSWAWLADERFRHIS